MLENIFRTEQKYYLTYCEYQELMNQIDNHLEKDKYYKERICSLYFDTDNYDLVINSLNKPLYKEKIRLRSYNTPASNDLVFLEIKKKYDGTVYKRRITLPYKEALNYINKGIVPDNQKQIFKEIDYCFKKYKLKPKVNISYDRYSYLDKDDKTFRITFDHNIKSSTTDLKLNDQLIGDSLIKDGYIMEIKSIKAIPFWLLKTLCELKIYPASFSKYGEVYKKLKESEIYV